MHELSLVEELITKCRERAEGRTVGEVLVRCSAGIDADEVSEGFAFLAPQDPEPGGSACLTRAQLKVETVPAYLNCRCGFEGELDKDHLAGHVGICPRCGHVGEVLATMELVAMSFVSLDLLAPP
jgi:Zn finger protein HypA/HybF involved in hydrogenase expression